MSRRLLLSGSLMLAFATMSPASGQVQSQLESRALEKQALLIGTGDASGTKVCSVFVPSNWRDSVNVGAGFTRQACIDYMRVVGANNFQLGCLYTNGIGFGLPNGGLPAQNCGW